MTDRIRSSRRLIIIGAALLAAAAVALVLGGRVQRVQSRVQVRRDRVLLALTLVFVAARAVDRPRASIAILHVISALVFLLGIVLVGIATAIVQGPSRRAAIFIMFLSGAAEFAAAGLVVAAASRLPGPATSEDTSAWKMRVAPAALLGIGSFFLMFLLGGVRFAANDTVAETRRWAHSRRCRGRILPARDLCALAWPAPGEPESLDRPRPERRASTLGTHRSDRRTEQLTGAAIAGNRDHLDRVFVRRAGAGSPCHQASRDGLTSAGLSSSQGHPGTRLLPWARFRDRAHRNGPAVVWGLHGCLGLPGGSIS